MDIEKLSIPTTTRMQVMDQQGNETDVFISGHTPDSKEWRKAQRENTPKGQKSLSMRVQKKGGSTVDLPTDPNAYENRIKVLAAVVTNIEGMTQHGQPMPFTPELVLDLFSNDGCAYIVEQWEDHMEERENFLKPAVNPVNSGSSVTAGTAPAHLDLGSNTPP